MGERGVSRFTVGQNVHEQSAFNSDADDYQFNPGTGHYTQIVWGETSKIGCGASIYKTGNPCSECPGNTVCSQQYPGLCQSNGAAGQLPVIVPEISSNVPTNTLDEMRPSTPLGSAGAFRPMFVQIPDNSNFGSTQSQLQPIPNRPNNV